MGIRYFSLADGRKLAYARIGDPTDCPIVFFHGAPGSAAGLPAAVGRHFPGQLIIAPERPGYGESDPAPGAGILAVADDVVSLLDTLQVERCALAGYSGGSAHALGCAKLLAERVSEVALYSPIAPLEEKSLAEEMMPSLRELFDSAADDPASLVEQLTDSLPDVEELLERFLASMSETDRSLACKPAIREALIAGFERAFMQGFDGWGWDFHRLANSWGFSPADIEAPVCINHGRDDRNTPQVMARYLHEVLPHSVLRLHSGKGHLFSFDDDFVEVSGRNVTAAAEYPQFPTRPWHGCRG